ncbi:MAG: Asp23/Gls24 family envelope stress response protein [Thermaerobacterales bacterium]
MERWDSEGEAQPKPLAARDSEAGADDETEAVVVGDTDVRPPLTTAGEGGEVRIGDDVVSVIAGIAAAEIDGVAGMSGGFVGGISEMLGKKNLSRGVKTEVGEKDCAVDLYIVVDYGVRIPSLAQKVQENVKQAVEGMTGLRVIGVNNHIQGVAFPSDERSQEARA